MGLKFNVLTMFSTVLPALEMLVSYVSQRIVVVQILSDFHYSNVVLLWAKISVDIEETRSFNMVSVLSIKILI